jgi:hypothetical protein
MIDSMHAVYAGRGFARRMTELSCELYTPDSDEPLVSWGTDLSESGLFVESETPLAPGRELCVCFKPAAGWRSSELMVFARVARVVRGLRREDIAPGMGLRFLDLAVRERHALSRWLAPRKRPGPSLRAARRAQPSAMFSEHPFAARFA